MLASNDLDLETLKFVSDLEDRRDNTLKILLIFRTLLLFYILEAYLMASQNLFSSKNILKDIVLDTIT